MSLQEHFHFLAWLSMAAFTAIVSLLAAMIAFQLLTGRINMGGLLRDKTNGQPSPGRMQLLLVTLAVAGAYIGAMLGAAPVEILIKPAAHGSLPELNDWVLEALGGSSLTYAGGKALPILRRVLSGA
jgi:hypothetical protein